MKAASAWRFFWFLSSVTEGVLSAHKKDALKIITCVHTQIKQICHQRIWADVSPRKPVYSLIFVMFCFVPTILFKFLLLVVMTKLGFRKIVQTHSQKTLLCYINSKVIWEHCKQSIILWYFPYFLATYKVTYAQLEGGHCDFTLVNFRDGFLLAIRGLDSHFCILPLGTSDQAIGDASKRVWFNAVTSGHVASLPFVLCTCRASCPIPTLFPEQAEIRMATVLKAIRLICDLQFCNLR